MFTNVLPLVLLQFSHLNNPFPLHKNICIYTLAYIFIQLYRVWLYLEVSWYKVIVRLIMDYLNFLDVYQDNQWKGKNNYKYKQNRLAPWHLSWQCLFLDWTPRAKATKRKINKWDYVKLKNFCKAKENINKMKSQPTEWEKISANYIFDKELISEICK